MKNYAPALMIYFAIRVSEILNKFRKNESGQGMVEDILKIAAIAIPILIILYVIVCFLCGPISEGLHKIGLDVDLSGICAFGPCS